MSPQAAHDLSNLLTVVGGYCFLAEKDCAELARVLGAAVEHLAQLKQAHRECCEIVTRERAAAALVATESGGSPWWLLMAQRVPNALFFARWGERPCSTTSARFS
jgi:hypothetical protein